MNNLSNAKGSLPITVVGGYLGTGKTSMVNHLLRHADGLRIAVLVNEFGSLSIDEDLIIDNSQSVDQQATKSKPSNLISIAGGCVCCSYGNDMTLALLNLLDLDPMPDHVLLEASGVAIPSAIAASVSLLNGYSMDGIVVLANAEDVQKQAADRYVGDTIIRQLEHADLVILNKADLVSENQLALTEQWLASVQAGAKVVPAEHGRLPPSLLLQSFLGRRDVLTSPSKTHDTSVYSTKTFDVDDPLDADGLAKALALNVPGVLRAKGFVKTASNSVAQEIRTIQVVGRRWSVTPSAGDIPTHVVVIGLSAVLDEQKIHVLLKEYAI